MSEEIDIEEVAPWLAAVITLIGGGLRVLLIAQKGMWLDETFSVWLASHSVAGMLHWIARIDQHPPLYYLLLHCWMALGGDTPYSVRLLSALFGTATIPVIYLIGKRLSGPVVGLAAAVFLAFSPFNIFYAQETRMYTCLTFNAAVAIYALARLLTDPRSARPIGSHLRDYLRAWRTPGPAEPAAGGDLSYEDEARARTGWRAWLSRHRRPPLRGIETDLAWAALIVFSAATLFSHNTAVFFLLAANVFVLGLALVQKRAGSLPSLQAPSVGNWAKAQAGILILWSPWIFVFIKQAGRVYQEFWLPKPTWETITQTLRALLNASAAGQISRVMTCILGAVLCLGLVYFRKKPAVLLFLAVLFAVPFLGELLVSIRRPIFIDRTLIWITIPMLLVLAAGVAQLRARLLVVLALGALAANYLFSTADYYRFWQKEDWSTAAGYVANFAEKGDLVLFNSNFVEIPFDYYFEPLENRYSLQVVKRGVPLDLFDSGVLEPKMTAGDIPGLLSLVSGHERVWLVYSHNSYTDPLGLIPPALASGMALIRERDFYGGRVQLYGSP